MAEKHSKVHSSLYDNCDGSEYLKHPEFTQQLAVILFKFRTRTYMVKNNFRNNYRNTNITCPVCHVSDDTQEHIMKCYKLLQIYPQKIQCHYDDIYSRSTDTLLIVATTLKELTMIREEILSKEKTELMEE